VRQESLGKEDAITQKPFGLMWGIWWCLFCRGWHQAEQMPEGPERSEVRRTETVDSVPVTSSLPPDSPHEPPFDGTLRGTNPRPEKLASSRKRVLRCIMESPRLSPPRNLARADLRAWRKLCPIPTRRASEGSSSVPQVTWGSLRWRVGLVFPFPFDRVEIGEESPIMSQVIIFLRILCTSMIIDPRRRFL